MYDTAKRGEPVKKRVRKSARQRRRRGVYIRLRDREGRERKGAGKTALQKQEEKKV